LLSFSSSLMRLLFLAERRNWLQRLPPICLRNRVTIAVDVDLFVLHDDDSIANTTSGRSSFLLLLLRVLVVLVVRQLGGGANAKDSAWSMRRHNADIISTTI